MRTSALPVVNAVDAADNMTAKVEPFKDDFSDGNCTGWAPYPTNGWSAANGYMQNTTAAGWSWYSRAQTDPSVDVQMSYRLDSGTQRMYVRPRQVNNANGDRVELVVYPTWMWLRQFVGGVMTDFGTWSNTSTAGSWYDLRVECDGANINVWKGPKGGAMTLVKQVSTCTVTTTDTLMFITVDSQWSFDDIRVLSDSLNSNSTLAYDNANELTSTTSDGNTTSYTYDAYGRMTAKTWGSYAATYAYRYGDKLTAVTSNFPGEGNVTYEYGGDSHRRERNDGAVTKFRWDDGWSVVEEENSGGALTTTYVGGGAEISGSNPGAGTYIYRFWDNIASTRTLRDQAKTSVSQYEFEPYGATYSQTGAVCDHLFTDHTLDSTSQLYYTTFRCRAPGLSCWISRDQLRADGPNLYSYVRMQPVNRIDPIGLSTVGLPGFNHPPMAPTEPYPSPTYTGGNPHKHCVNTCVLASHVGSFPAWYLADIVKENWDYAMCWGFHHRAYCCSAHQDSDYRDNARGRRCAKDCSYTGKNRCIECCSKYEVGPGTPEGPGTARPCGPINWLGWWGVPY
ncbi:MAG: hypothetical protein HZB26_12485 [Candidatus Hydrogenedentes bacterium]|nr:hypothetical protein [Candidatus Hydrogenedentota bacterium]